MTKNLIATHKIYVLVHNCGDGSVSVDLTTDKERASLMYALDELYEEEGFAEQPYFNRELRVYDDGSVELSEDNDPLKNAYSLQDYNLETNKFEEVPQKVQAVKERAKEMLDNEWFLKD